VTSNRRLDNKYNIFEGIHRNIFFVIINLIMIGGQVMIIFVGGRAFSVVRLTGNQWAISIVMGFVSIPVGIIIRTIPDSIIARLLPLGWQKSLAPETIRKELQEDGPENLGFINRWKGGRIRHARSRVGTFSSN
jgi:Ca2+-transporting ATPase